MQFFALYIEKNACFETLLGQRWLNLFIHFGFQREWMLIVFCCCSPLNLQIYFAQSTGLFTAEYLYEYFQVCYFMDFFYYIR